MQARAKIDFRGVELLPPDGVRVKEGLELDLGGAAKGYAVDRALSVLKERGIRRALINAGGQIGLLGEAPRGSWQIGVQAPRGGAHWLCWLWRAGPSPPQGIINVFLQLGEGATIIF